MEYINLERLSKNLDGIRSTFQSERPFRYTVIEAFFNPEKAEFMYANYPRITDDVWDGTTYIDQKNKFQKTTFETGSWMEKVFGELNSLRFTRWLEELTGIKEILPDDTLLGGGLHQSCAGAFLNVHIDYNQHHTTKLHRRLNVLVYLNKDWKDNYEGHLELWDLTKSNGKMIKKIAPTFNRCVIFETNEVSFHGHPKPLSTPPGVTRKSIATYYYTASRPVQEIAPEHNTIYVNTEGVRGQAKRLRSGMKALLERIDKL